MDVVFVFFGERHRFFSKMAAAGMGDVKVGKRPTYAGDDDWLQTEGVILAEFYLRTYVLVKFFYLETWTDL